MNPPIDYHDLIPEIQSWEDHNNRKFDPGDWIGCCGSFEHAIGYLWLFWRSFVVHDDCILRANFTPANYQQWFAATEGNRQSIEAVINHVHLADWFNSQGKPTIRQLQWLGSTLQEMWDAKLRRDFPDRPIRVSFDQPDDPSDLVGYTLTVYQVRS